MKTTVEFKIKQRNKLKSNTYANVGLRYCIMVNTNTLTMKPVTTQATANPVLQFICIVHVLFPTSTVIARLLRLSLLLATCCYSFFF